MQYWNLYINESDKTNASGNSDDYGAYGELAVLLSHYVKKEKGKGLSSNDFTDIEKSKLANIPANAEENVIESISVNGIQQEITDKNINIEIEEEGSITVPLKEFTDIIICVYFTSYRQKEPKGDRKHYNCFCRTDPARKIKISANRKHKRKD